MRHILASVVLIVLLFPALAMGGEVTYWDLVITDGLYYKKFTDVPFTGKVTGNEQGAFKNGKKDGPWVIYHTNGQLWQKATYNDGKAVGPWVNYWYNGQLAEKGTFKNGKSDGPSVRYHDNGQIFSKGTYKDGKWDGPWVGYFYDGTVIESLTGTFKDGVRISD